MPTAGELLRDERLRRGWSIAQVSEQTRISHRYLEAIEADHLEDLPGEFFHRAFLRQYAKALQLDPATTAQVLDAAGPQQAPDPVPALNAAYENAQTGADLRPKLPTGLLIVLLLGAIIGGSGMYAWWQHVQARQAQREVASDTKSESLQTEPTPTSLPAAPVTSPESTAPTNVPADPGVPVTSAGQLALSATEKVWISVESGGERLFSGTLEPGDSRSYTLQGAGRLVVGNAGGLAGSFSGKPLGNIGPRGQVRVVTFSDGEFQVLESRRKLQAEQ
jgi:cytoskeleton protein RodZ